VPTEPGSPLPSPDLPSGPGSLTDQDQVLAMELAAFPAEDEPDWEALERLEYCDDADSLAPAPQTADAPASAISSTTTGSPASPVPSATNGSAIHPATRIPHAADTPADTPASARAPGLSADAATIGPGAPAEDKGAGVRSGFAHDGAADAMPPGPWLAELADRTWQDGLSRLDDDELTGLLRAWQRLGARAAAGLLAAASELVARREAEGRATGEWRPFEHVDDEITAALTLTRPSAARLLGLATALDRLPLTRASLAAGHLDERRAAVIADELIGLDDDHAAAVEALVIEKAATQTTGQLRPAVRRAVIAADPSAAKRRKEEALKDARVETSTEHSGTASMAGRDLPPAEVLAADRNLTALAREMKKAGIAGTMDLLRARAYLHLLSGQPAETLLVPPAPVTSTRGPGAPGPGSPGPGATGTSGPDAPDPGHPADNAPAGRPANDGARDPRDSTSRDSTSRDSTSGPGATGPGGPGLGLGPLTLHGTVNLTMPLVTWLGWSQAPGQVPGFGALDADDSRAIATMLATDPATQWCVTLTDPAGRPVAHGCAKNGPPPPGKSRPRMGPGPDAGPGAGPGLGSLAGPGPPGDLEWVRAVTITALERGTCTHPRETAAYQPGAALRHIIQIRQATCSYPGCRRAASGCDLDHTVPYDEGGRSCECNIGPVCRKHHRAKQAPGWALSQDEPGIMTWSTPGRRTYSSGPTCYPA
jgi:hypothetical protein